MRGLLAGLLLLSTAGFTAQAQAGVALGATRVIYPAGQKQAQLAVTNNDDSTYLIQSWVENADGAKDGSFVITPPLFAMQGKRIPCASSMPPMASCRRTGKRCSG